MFRPVPMLKLRVLLLDRDVDALTRALGRIGVLHLINAVAQSEHQLLSGVDRSAAIRRLETLTQRCRDVMENLDIPPAIATTLAATPPVSGDDIERFLDRCTQAYRAEDDALGRLIEASGLLRREVQVLDGYPLLDTVRLKELRNLHHLFLITGRLSPAALPGLTARLGERTLLFSDAAKDPFAKEVRVLLLGARKSRFAIEGELGKAGFKEEPVPAGFDESGAAERRRAADRLEQLRLEIEEKRERIKALAALHGPELAAAWRQLQQGLAIARAQQHYGKTAGLYCISGWLPESRQGDVLTVAERVTHGAAVVDFTAPEEDEQVRLGHETVPVQFPAIAALRPFQLIVTTFGPPRYTEVEPSLFVAISFVLMFGLMFGDVGQGAVLALTGGYCAASHNAKVRKLKDVGYLLLFCGLSAMGFGLLYGSVFGNDRLITPLWVEPLRDVMALFETAIVIGIICISVGIVINIVNKIRQRDYFGGIVDRFGVIGILFYWGSLGLGLKAARTGVVRGHELFLVIVAPLLILFLKEPLHALLRRRRQLLEDNAFTFVLLSGMEVLETVNTFLANTVSFIRVGAFALSHAALCMTIYIVSDMVRELPGGGFWVMLTLILGNLIVIVLEGMVATIQGLRLQYYELFSKYFSGDGVLYHPFSTDSVGQLQTKENL